MSLVDHLVEVYTRENCGPIEWLREYTPFELLELQKRARLSITKGGALTADAVKDLEEAISSSMTARAAARRVANERNVRFYEVLRDLVVQREKTGQRPADPESWQAFEQELVSILGCIDGPVKKRVLDTLKVLENLLVQDRSIADASGAELFHRVTGEVPGEATPAACKCVSVADVLADRIRRCEQVHTPKERMVYLLVWLIATDPGFDPRSVGLQGFREWNSDPPDGNPYDRREAIVEWIGWSSSGLYLGASFREAGRRTRQLRLRDLMPSMAQLALEVLRMEQRDLAGQSEKTYEVEYEWPPVVKVPQVTITFRNDRPGVVDRCEIRGQTIARLARAVIESPDQDHTWVDLTRAGGTAGDWVSGPTSLERVGRRIRNLLPTSSRYRWDQDARGVRWSSS